MATLSLPCVAGQMTAKPGARLEVDYTTNGSTFTITAVRGYRNSYENWLATRNLAISISYPGGSGTFYSVKGVSHRDGVGYKSGGYNWHLNSDTTTFTGNGSGKISITVPPESSSQVGGTFTSTDDIYLAPPVYTPVLNGPYISDVTDTKAHLNYGISDNGGAGITDYYIDVATGNFSNVVKTLTTYDGDVTGLTPGYTYYVRANSSNGSYRGYTGVASFTTLFYDPGAPGKPTITYNTPELVPSSRVTVSWSKASNGSTPIKGYRVRIFKNGQSQNESTMDTNSTNTSLTFDLSTYNFQEGDRLMIGIYSYCLRHDGAQIFNGGGQTASQVYSDSIVVHPERFCKVSQNNGAFTKRKVYISMNGTAFMEVKKGW